MSRSVRSLIVLPMVLALVVLLWPAEAHAQRARARRVSPPRVVRTHVSVYRPFYYYPYYYDRFFWGSFWGPYGWYPAFYYAQYPYPRYPYRGYYYDESSLRIQVKPNEAEVYVDGYYMGVVDSFDGVFQRLHLPPGDHVIEIFHEGYRPIRETMRFLPREGYELKRVMEPLAAGDPAPVRPAPDPSARPVRDPRDPYDRRDQPRERRPDDVRVADSGAVAIRVQPAGATVLIDGQKWEGPEGPDRLVIHLSEGTHKIEIQKEGYRPFVTEVRIRRGETVPLNVSLRTAG